MLKVGVPRFTRVPQLLVYNLNFLKIKPAIRFPRIAGFQSVKEHSVKLSRNSKIYAAVEKTGKNAVKSRAVPAPCC